MPPERSAPSLINGWTKMQELKFKMILDIISVQLSILHGMSVETVSFFMSYLGKVVALFSRVSLKKRLSTTVSHPFVENVRRIHQQPR